MTPGKVENHSYKRFYKQEAHESENLKLLLSLMVLQQIEPEMKNVKFKAKVYSFLGRTRLSGPAAPASWGRPAGHRASAPFTPDPTASTH